MRYIKFVGSQGATFSPPPEHYPQWPAQLHLQLTLQDLETIMESLTQTMQSLRRGEAQLQGLDGIVFEATLYGTLFDIASDGT